MPKFYWDIEQGSAPWYSARKGIPTASNFHLIMTPATMKPSASRKGYACRLILERLMNWQADSLDKIEHIAAGKANEPIAIAKMEIVFDIKSEPIGFIASDDGRFGASPDRVSGVSAGRDSVNTVIEAKSPTAHVQMERFLFGHEKPEYRCQRQGQMLVSGADKAIFYSYNERMPDVIVEDGRDEAFLSKLEDCLERFHDELSEWTEKARKWGAFQKFAEATPIEAAHARNLRTGPVMSEEELDGLINTEHYKWGG